MAEDQMPWTGGSPDPAHRRPIMAALDAQASTPAKIVVIGDSITEGYYATALAHRWIERFADRIGRAIAGAPAALYYPATSGQSFWPWTRAGGSDNTTYGLGRRAYNVGAGATMSIAFTGTAFRLFYTRQPSGGVFSYAVDGGSATNVDTSGAEASARVIEVTGLSAGAHTVSIARVSGTSVVEGLIGFNGNLTSGIHVYDGGHSGYASGDFVDGAAPRWIDAIAAIEPDLVIVELGVNDAYLGVSAATFKSNVETLLANIIATGVDPTVVLVGLYQAGITYSADPWASYLDKLDELARAGLFAETIPSQARTGFLDLAPAFGGAAAVTTALGTMHPDRVHPTSAGHSVIADRILEILLGPHAVTRSPAAPLPFRGAKAKHSADQALTSGAYVTLKFDTNHVDTDYMHRTSSANLTGTVAKTAGSTTLVGTGTAFLSELSVGQVITVPGTAVEKRVVTAIGSNTSLTVSAAYANSASGQTATRVNSAFVATAAGVYRVTASAAVTASPGAGTFIAILLNDDGNVVTSARAIGPIPNDTVEGEGVITTTLAMAQWDYVECAIRVGAAAKNALAAASYSPVMSFEYAGAA